jgi:hypothetical protein
MAKAARLAPIIAFVAVALCGAIFLIFSGRAALTQKSLLKQKTPAWSAEVGTDSVFLPKTAPSSGITFHALKARIQSLAENPIDELNARFQILDEVPYSEPATNIKVMEMEYNLCESCYTAKCPYFVKNGCDREYVKPQCYPEVLLAACPDCGKEGCDAVLEFVQNDGDLNATAGSIMTHVCSILFSITLRRSSVFLNFCCIMSGGDNITKISLLRDLTWSDARHKAVESFPEFRSCISAADTVALAENCLVDFLHPFPADILKAVSKTKL